jgi:methionyl-tRNA formyltransferase
MQMDEGLDTGDILLRRTCPIEKNDTAQTLHDKLAEIGAASILETLRMLQENRLEPIKQINEAASYAPKLIKSEAQIDWRQDAQQIERAIRAFNPFPVSQTHFNGTTVKIWQASLCVDKQGEPGKVLALDKQGITVACGKNALRLEVLQRSGGKTQPAAQFLQSMPIKVGTAFSELSA